MRFGLAEFQSLAWNGFPNWNNITSDASLWALATALLKQDVNFTKARVLILRGRELLRLHNARYFSAESTGMEKMACRKPKYSDKTAGAQFNPFCDGEREKSSLVISNSPRSRLTNTFRANFSSSDGFFPLLIPFLISHSVPLRPGRLAHILHFSLSFPIPITSL